MNKQTESSSKKTRRPVSAEQQRQALEKAITGQSLANYGAIYEGFEAMGIPALEIKPRENVFTFNAWKAVGRAVRKGQHGVKVVTVVKRERANTETGEMEISSYPITTTVFHISQTDAIN